VFRTRGTGSRHGVRIVAIEKCLPYIRSGRIPKSGGVTRAVVGNKEAHVLVQDQMQIAMEEDCIAAVSDDAVTVARLLVKAVTHRIRSIIERKETRMHQARGFRFEYLRIT